MVTAHGMNQKKTALRLNSPKTKMSMENQPFEDVPGSETNSEFTPEDGWLEDFLLSFCGQRPIFIGKLAVSSLEGISH